MPIFQRGVDAASYEWLLKEQKRRAFRFPAYRLPAIKVEDYSCPKCGSKDLQPIGRRTLRCKKCGTTFTIQPETVETHFIIWPIPVEK